MKANRDKILKALANAQATAERTLESCCKIRQLLEEEGVSTSANDQRHQSLAATAIAKRRGRKP